MHFFDCCRQWTEFILQVKTKSPHARSSKVLWIQLRLGAISLTTRLPDQVKPPHPQFQCWCELCWATCEIFSPKETVQSVEMQTFSTLRLGVQGFAIPKKLVSGKHLYVPLIFDLNFYLQNLFGQQ